MEAEDSSGSTPKNFRNHSSSIDQPSTSSSVVSLSGHLPIHNSTQQHLAGSIGGHSCSDDSGCLVQNSSMSSGDSSRVYLKHDFEVIESDGEVSQFDSLDNSNSEGGMSAENFNTLKKGPLAPIDPPPEFQDSPQTTLLRTRGYHDFAQLLIKDILGEAFLSLLHHHHHHQTTTPLLVMTPRPHISASDPQLNVSSGVDAAAAPPENIYDEPSDSTRNSDDIEVDYYISKQVTSSSSLARKKSSTLSANSQQLLLRPNSRNSLQSRLSSSHNSLATQGGSKVDDTTFITQAMSHDPLMGRQSIIDFYNVPLDSDIYALPVDVVSPSEAEVEEVQVESREQRRSRRFKFPTSPGAGHRLPLAVQKSSEEKRRLFRKAQAAAASASAKLTTRASSMSHSQLVVPVTTTAVGNGRSVDAKRFSAPDGLIETVSYAARSRSQKKKMKREKRPTAGQGHSKGTVAAAATTVETDSSDAEVMVVETVVNGETERAGGSGGLKEAEKRDRGGGMAKRRENGTESKSGRENKSMGPLTITISKTLNKAAKEKKASIPISTSFTSQSSIQSNCATGGGGVVVGDSSGRDASSSSGGGGKTTKRETRDATKRGHNQFSTNLKQKFCSIFRFRNSKQSLLVEYENNNNYEITGSSNGGQQKGNNSDRSAENKSNSASTNGGTTAVKRNQSNTIMLRALPPLPKRAPPEVPAATSSGGAAEANRRRPPAELPPDSPSVEIDSNNNDVLSYVAEGAAASAVQELFEEADNEPMAGRLDFASNLETIKQYGWYWGPISCQAAEKILSNEPDGSFIVRDSSDDHYIFSLTFKLNNCVRHVRIEQDKGTFSFGSLAKFKARTIVEFIEQALEYSRSGRYLFFLHRRPEHGPMRVQLKNPVSRFKHIQSLQHICRFVIMKAIVRKDLIPSLPLPNRLKDYLSYKNCYTEHFDDTVEAENVDLPGDTAV